MGSKKGNKELKTNDYKGKKVLLNFTNSTDVQCPVWLFSNIDRAGKFAFDVNREDFKHAEVLGKMIDYSNMTWSEIKRQTHDDGKSKHHLLQHDELSKEAQERFRAKRLDEDSDLIFSFALQNKLRIIGIRRDEKFQVLWYDPEHEVCPSYKKHT